MLPGFFLVSALWNWIHRLGGLSLIVVGIVDNSFIPIPGGVDAITIILAAHKREWWWFYAVMATVGAVAGGYLTFRLGRKGGEEALEKKIPGNQSKKVYGIFNKFGFWAVAVPAILPPPVPIVPFLLTAGALNYSRRKFVLALTLGRGLRYTVVAYLGRTYARQIFGFFGRYHQPILIGLIALAVCGGIAGLMFYLKKRKSRATEQKLPQEKAA